MSTMFKDGDRVAVPRVKTTGCSYDDFIKTQTTKGTMPDYFVVMTHNSRTNRVVLAAPIGHFGIWLFSASDLELYKEPAIRTWKPVSSAPLVYIRPSDTADRDFINARMGGKSSTQSEVDKLFNTVPSASNAASRYNSGKPLYSLLSLEALQPCVEVLMFGKNKYSSIFVPKLEQTLESWNVKTVRETGILRLKDYVTVATSDSCLIAIKSVRSVSDSTNVSTNVKTENDFLNIIGVERKNVVQALSTKRNDEILTTLRSMVSPLTSSIDGDKTVVSFVENKRPLCTQITTIRLESLEVCFAVSAITGWDSSTMTLRCLEKLSGISLDSSYIVTGANNWKKGLKKSEVIDSMLRHVKAILEGEENDPESGLSHIGHIQCNAMFLGHSSIINDMENA